MIGTIFQLGNELVEVRVEGHNVLFRTKQFGGGFVPIDNINLDKSGVIKEHPDLEDKENWREETIKRFKEHINKMEDENKIMNYLIEELKKCGYIPLYIQRGGQRPIKLQ